MDFYQLIKNRQSVRNYDSNHQVNKLILKRIVEAGRLAPSAANLQPWKFIVVSSKKMLAKVSLCYNRDWFNKAPHILIAAGDMKKAWTRQADGYNSLETDLAIAMDHMILAAEFEGVATCWIAAFDEPRLKKVLNLTKNQRVYAMTPLGYSEKNFIKNGDKKRKTLKEIIKTI